MIKTFGVIHTFIKPLLIPDQNHESRLLDTSILYISTPPWLWICWLIISAKKYGDRPPKWERENWIGDQRVQTLLCSQTRISRKFSKISRKGPIFQQTVERLESAHFGCLGNGTWHWAIICRHGYDWQLAPIIKYRFKRRLFSRRPCTRPHPWACPHSRLQWLA